MRDQARHELLNMLTQVELAELLWVRGVPTSGLKADRIRRLIK